MYLFKLDREWIVIQFSKFSYFWVNSVGIGTYYGDVTGVEKLGPPKEYKFRYWLEDKKDPLEVQLDERRVSGKGRCYRERSVK